MRAFPIVASLLITIIAAFPKTAVTAVTPDQAAIDSLIADVKSCGRAKDTFCLTQYTDDPEALYVTSQDGKRELYPGFSEEAFKASGASLYTVSVGHRYKHKIFMTSDTSAVMIFYDGTKAGPADSFDKMIATEDVLHCDVRRGRSAWKLSNAVCSYIYAGEEE